MKNHHKQLCQPIIQPKHPQTGQHKLKLPKKNEPTEPQQPQQPNNIDHLTQPERSWATKFTWNHSNNLNNCDISPSHVCRVLLCCLHISHHIGLHRSSTAHTAHTGSGAELLLLSLIHDQRACTHRTAALHACLFQAVAVSTCDQVIHFFSFGCGAMASSAVSSVLYLRDAAVHTSITEVQRASTNCNYALDFARLVKLATNTSKHRPKCVTDYVSRHKKLTSMTCAKLSKAVAWY